MTLGRCTRGPLRWECGRLGRHSVVTGCPILASFPDHLLPVLGPIGCRVQSLMFPFESQNGED